MAKILLVEDEVQIARLLGRILSPLGTVQLSHDGGSGYVKYLKNRHDLIICDVCMPVADGLEMAQKIRQISADVPIIIVSAFSETPKLLRAIDARVNKYLIKPIDPEELLELARKMLSERLNCMQIGGSVVDFAAAKFNRADGSASALSPREMQLLRALGEQKTLSSEQIMRLCWPNRSVQEASVRTLIKRLRDKMGADGAAIVSIPRAGYRLDL